MRPKRLISLLVAVCMMITMLPLSAVTAFAADTASSTRHTTTINGFECTYTVNADGDATITYFDEPDTTYDYYNIDIPETLDDKYTVTAIGRYAFSQCIYLWKVTIPQSVTSIGEHAFDLCTSMRSLTINDATTSIGDGAFRECRHLTTLELGEHITTIGEYAFYQCYDLDNVIIPDSVTSIGRSAFARCFKLQTLKLGENIETIGGPVEMGIIDGVFCSCYQLSKIIIPEKVEKIETYTFAGCPLLKSITLPAGLKYFEASLDGCSPDCVIYYNGNEHDADTLRKNNPVLEDAVQKGHQLLYRCNVTFDANGGTLTDKGGNPTDHAVVSAYKTQKINADDLKAIPDPTRAGYNFTGWYTEKGQHFDVNDIITKDMTEDITFYARWEPAPKAPVCHPLTVTGGTVTVKYDGSDVTSKLNSNTDATTGQKTYYVPEGAEVTVTLNKTAVPNGKVFDGWSTTGNLSLLTGQDYKAESITFSMSSGVNVSAKYRDAAADHTPNTAVFHPLTVTGGIVTVKNGDKDVTNTLTVTTDETTGKKTYSVPDGATVTVTLDKNLIPKGNVFDSWSTGNLSLLTGQDSKAETITFTMNSDAKVSAKYRDAAADHTHDTAVCHQLTVTGGIVTVKKGDKDVTDTLTVTTDKATGKKTYYVPDNATVTVTLDKTLIPEGMVFDIWSTGKFSLPLGQDYKAESITFPMSSDVVDIAAQYRDATIEDDGPNVLGTAAIIGTAAVGGAVLGYQAYSLGAEFAGKLMALPYFPSNRSALAMMLWEDAGKPMPESELLYPDVEQEERDMDLQHAARWAMENELIPDLNDEGTAPEEMKFFPANPVSKLDVLNAWQKAQELKNN